MTSPVSHPSELHHAGDADAPLPLDGATVASDGAIARPLPRTAEGFRSLGWRTGSGLDLRWAAAALAGLLALCIAIQMAWPLATLGRHISLNNNEGWNAYWSTRALTGQPIYTNIGSPLSNNYTPLSFYIVGWFGRAIGDLVLAGRILALAGLGGCALLVGLVAARLGKETRWGWAAAASFLVIAVTIAPRYIAADDPQWMAEAIQMIALWILVQRPQFTATRLIAACLILLLAGLIKHNQVALPLAITLALAVHDRRGLAIWMATGVAATLLALAGLQGIYGPAFFDQVLHHQRVLHLYYIWPALWTTAFLIPAGVIAAVYLPRLPGWRRDPRLTMLVAFAVLGVILGIFERFGTGVSQNAHFDALLAVTILFGVVLVRSEQASLSAASRLALITLAIAPAAAKDLASLPRQAERWQEIDRTDEAWRNAVRFLATRPGPIACERPALCYWAGKPYALDFSNYGQKLRRIGDPWHLRDRIAHREFGALVVIRDDRYEKGDARLPYDYYALIDANYRVERVLPDDLYVMVPKR
jgi:hypothetical protein